MVAGPSCESTIIALPQPQAPGRSPYAGAKGDHGLSMLGAKEEGATHYRVARSLILLVLIRLRIRMHDIPAFGTCPLIHSRNWCTSWSSFHGSTTTRASFPAECRILFLLGAVKIHHFNVPISKSFYNPPAWITLPCTSMLSKEHRPLRIDMLFEHASDIPIKVL